MPQKLTRNEREELELTLRQVFGEQEVQALLAVLERMAFRGSTRGMRQDLQELKHLGAQLVEGQRTLQEALAQLVQAQVGTEGRVGKVEEGQRALQEAVTQLARAQARTEERLHQVEGQIQQLVAAQQRTEERLQQTEGQIRQLVEAQQRTEERLAALTEAQQRTEERLAALTEAQQRTDVQLQQTGEQIRQLTVQVQDLLTWQRGEAGRREGERYEREVLRRAPALFVGGRGGTPEQLEVQQRLTKKLRGLLARDLRTEWTVA